MVIREATSHDIPAIVSLLKISLGETLLPKSEAYWNWKHVENPFGQSPTLLALEGDQIVGVRAFMCWEWKTSDEQVRAVRAVDTATHPDFQGKGIFKKLTLQLLEYCKNQGYGFVFNTPNNSSKPGYLKMGWEQAGKLPVHMQLSNAMGVAGSLLKIPRDSPNVNASSLQELLAMPNLDQVILEHQRQHANLATRYSAGYFRWRYAQVPIVKYFAAPFGENKMDGFFCYRLKASRLGNELRITDFISSNTANLKQVRSLIHRKASEHKADYITLSGTGARSALGFPSMKLSVGPVVTIKNVNYNNFSRLQNFSGWNPSLGDLELF